MKTIYILRHAKSSWDNPNIADFERPLNERGLKAAPFMGEVMLKHNFHPEIILSSPAIRAKETAELVKTSANFEQEIKFDELIYEAEPQTLFQIISEIDETAQSAMIVGHNPGLEGLVKTLTGELQPMPTACLAVIDLEIGDWSEIVAGKGNLRTMIRPKEESSQ